MVSMGTRTVCSMGKTKNGKRRFYITIPIKMSESLDIDAGGQLNVGECAYLGKDKNYVRKHDIQAHVNKSEKAKVISPGLMDGAQPSAAKSIEYEPKDVSTKGKTPGPKEYSQNDIMVHGQIRAYMVKGADKDFIRKALEQLDDEKLPEDIEAYLK